LPLRAFPTVLDHLCCSICTDIYTEPVSLSCQHTFSKRCLQRSLKAGHIRCPECRVQLKETTFQINRLIKNMADQLKLEEKEVSNMKMQQGRGGREAQQTVWRANFQISTLIGNMEDQLKLDDRNGQRESDQRRTWGREEDWLVKEASRLPNFQ
uniref:RING-type domain-containing protein n=1 Tax=Hucho hucho TaxID=62062 RepID=A0A4W5MYM7_9TELE